MASGGDKSKVPVSLDNFETLNAPLDSPRSLRALRECGYVPKDVYTKPLHLFVDKKVADAELRKNLAQVKYEHLEGKRREKLRLVRAERARIIDRQNKRRSSVGSSGVSNNNADAEEAEGEAGESGEGNVARPRPASAPEPAMSPASPGVAAAREKMLKQEEARLDRMRKKQEREMAAIVEFETNLVKKKVEAEQKIQRDMERLAKRNAAKKARERQLIVKKRQIQLAKKRAADEERERLRDRLKEEFEKEKEEAAKIAAEKEAIEIERRRRYQKALKEKLERERSKEERELQHAQELNAKLDEMEAEAAARKAKMIERKAEEAAAIKEKQALAAQRIQEALERDAKIQEKIKADFYKRQRDAAVRKEEQEREAEKALRKHQAMLEQKAQRRQNKYREAMQQKKEKIHSFVVHSEEQDERLKAMTQKQHQQRAMHNLRRRLELEDRADNVERNARLREFKRLQLLEKIEAEDRKTQELLKAKEELMEQRKRTAKQVLQKKHELADQMLELQITKKLPGQGGTKKKTEKRRKTRKVAQRRAKNNPQTRANSVDDADFDFEELFSSNFYAS